MSVLGAIFLDEECIDEISELSAAEFYRSSHQTLFETMQALRQTGTPIDPVTIASLLKDSGQLEEVGGTAYISTLMDCVPSSGPVKHYAQSVKREARRREGIRIATEAVDNFYGEPDAEKVFSQLESSLFRAAQGQAGSAVFAKDAVRRVVKQMEEAYNNGGQLSGLSTGFKMLDEATCGLQDSDLIIIGARPSVGKTALGVNLAENISIANDVPGLIVSREMSTDAIVRRMICSGARVDLMQGMRGTFQASKFPEIVAAAGKIAESRLMIDDRELNIQQIRAEARRQKRKNDIKYLMVDYLQLINSPGHDGRTAEIEHVSNQLKACAKELNIPVVALAQINRESDKEKSSTPPQMHQLKGSGALEQDADVVILLHRPKENIDEDAEAIIAKQRNGPLKRIPLKFYGGLTRFTERHYTGRGE